MLAKPFRRAHDSREEAEECRGWVKEEAKETRAAFHRGKRGFLRPVYGVAG